MENDEHDGKAAALTQVRMAARAIEVAEANMRDAIAHARHAGATWDDLGDLFGVSRQAIHRRFGGIE